MGERNSFTNEELAIAKSVDLTVVTENLGYTVRKIGNYFTLKMDSIGKIKFCLHNDSLYRKAVQTLMKKYYELRYEVEDCLLPKAYKDYNVCLQALRKEDLLKYSVMKWYK